MPETVYYECQRCGNCCRWPGTVRLTQLETERIAAHLGLTTEIFVDQYCHLLPDRSGLTLVAKPDDSCIFLEGKNECQIQTVKPQQCRNFPNVWNFPGWREKCEAIPVVKETESTCPTTSANS